MKVLLISQYYPPVKGAGARRAKRFANFLTETGHKVTVLSGFPTYQTGTIPEKYRWKLWLWEKDGPIKVLRVYEFPAVTAATFQRLLNMVTFFLTSTIAAIILPVFDTVVVTSPPFLSGLTGLAAAREKKCKFIFDIRDLWPEVTLELGVMKPGFVYNLFKRLEKVFYQKANHITTATERIRRRLILQGIPGKKVTTIYNSADLNLFRPEKIERAEFGFSETDFICVYIGNHSRVYNLENVVEVANLLKNRPIKFVFVGVGESKPALIELAQKYELSNIIFLPEKTPQEISVLINLSDVGIISLDDKPMFQETVPAKTAEYLACAKPIIATIGGEVKKLLEENQAGLVCEPKNPEALSQAVLKLYKNKVLTQKMGENARRLAIKFSDYIFFKHVKKIMASTYQA